MEKSTLFKTFPSICISGKLTVDVLAGWIETSVFFMLMVQIFLVATERELISCYRSSSDLATKVQSSAYRRSHTRALVTFVFCFQAMFVEDSFVRSVGNLNSYVRLLESRLKHHSEYEAE